jgi:hypothetical protein
MVVSPAGTFDYECTVPSCLPTGDRVWQVRTRAASLARTADGRRLVGRDPTMSLEDFDTPHGVPRTRIVLRADPSDSSAAVETFSFVVDRALATMLRPNDTIYINRSGDVSLGMSVLREGRLIAAVGAVANVPLGPEVSVGEAPLEILREVEAAFCRVDPDYHLPVRPVMVSIGGTRLLLHGGRRSLGGYDIFVVHGSLAGKPGECACLSVSLKGVCPDCAASLTAPLLKEQSFSSR